MFSADTVLLVVSAVRPVKTSLRACSIFSQARESDIGDTSGGTTAGAATSAGTVDLLERGFTGVEWRGDVLRASTPYRRS